MIPFDVLLAKAYGRSMPHSGRVSRPPGLGCWWVFGEWDPEWRLAANDARVQPLHRV